MDEPIPLLNVTIDHLSPKGRGIAFFRKDSQSTLSKVEVPHAIPGDQVIVQLGRRRKGKYLGILQEIIAASTERVETRCRHAVSCGGCSLQQMEYQAQLKLKETLIAKTFAPFLSQQKTVLHPILACSAPWGYRNKMEFTFSQNQAGERFLGLMIAGAKNKVLHLSECHLASLWAVRVLHRVRVWWEKTGLQAYHSPSNRGALRTLILREGKRTGDKMAMLTVSGNPEFSLSKAHMQSFVEALRLATLSQDRMSIFLRIQQVIKGSPTQFYEWHLYGSDHIREKLLIQENGKTSEVLFKISPTSFFQPNTYQAEALYSKALQMASNKTPKKLIFDLYCGTATLGILFSRIAEKVIGIELNPHAIFDATANKELNGITNLELHCGDVGKTLHMFLSQKKFTRPDLVVLDPPRTGLEPKALDHLLALSPKEILYISCNPSTQAENIKVLHEGGYHLLELQPVDQFPHTMHIENIALLRKV